MIHKDRNNSETWRQLNNGSLFWAFQFSPVYGEDNQWLANFIVSSDVDRELDSIVDCIDCWDQAGVPTEKHCNAISLGLEPHFPPDNYLFIDLCLWHFHSRKKGCNLKHPLETNGLGICWNERVKQVAQNWPSFLFPPSGLKQDAYLVYSDCQSTAANAIYHARAKHIGYRYHWIREALE